jgi:hypothetical protein
MNLSMKQRKSHLLKSHTPQIVPQARAAQPPADEFADMTEQLFAFEQPEFF